MRYLLVFVITLVFAQKSYSQTFEIGPYIGGANYIGDVGRTNFILPNNLVGGALIKWNRSARHAFRFSLMYAEISADDANANDARRKNRGYSFNNTIAEASLGIEYNFWSFDLHEGHPQSTPYLYSGISYFKSDHLKLDAPGGKLVNETANWSFAIPIVFGYKESITRHIIGALEIGARYTFTDNLDGSWPEELTGDRSSVTGLEFGNENTNDWYVFTGVSFTFSWGRKPCYSNF